MSSLSEILEFIKAGSKVQKTDWEAQGRKDRELWQAWKDSGEHPDAFRPLLNQFKAAIGHSASRWINHVDIPPSVIKAEYDKQFLNAARQYDPAKNPAFGAYIKQFCFKKVSRYFTTYQNPARIIETRSGHQRRRYNDAISTLADQYGREPTTDELSEHLGWSPAEVSRAAAEDRGALVSGAIAPGTDMKAKDESEFTPSRELEVLRLIKPQLSPEEKTVYEFLIGDGKPKLKPGEIATRLGWNPSRVTRYKNAIADKVKKYL